jgi:hypothetical protein
VKIAAIFLLVCAAPVMVAARQSAGPSSQAPAVPATPPQQTAQPTEKAAPAVDPAKEGAIRKLLDVQGTRNLMQQVVASMSNSMRPMLESSLPPGEYRVQLIELFFQRFQSKFNVDQLVDLVVPIYDKYLSIEDLEGLTKFYQTPLGQKAISVLPQLMLEAQAAGRTLGEKVGRESMLEVLDEHPDLKKSLEKAAGPPKG